MENSQNNLNENSTPAQPVIQPATTSTRDVKQDKKKIKIVGILLTEVVILIIGIAGFLYMFNTFSQSQSATNSLSKLNGSTNVIPSVSDDVPNLTKNTGIPSGWLKYKNADLGYSINYPDEIFTGKAKVEEDGKGNVAINYFTLSGLEVDGPPPHFIGVQRLREYSTAEQYINGILEANKLSPTAAPFKTENITIDGRQALKITDFPSAHGLIIILVVNNDQLYRIVASPTLPSTDPNELKWKEDYNKAFSSFSFGK